MGLTEEVDTCTGTSSLEKNLLPLLLAADANVSTSKTVTMLSMVSKSRLTSSLWKSLTFHLVLDGNGGEGALDGVLSERVDLDRNEDPSALASQLADYLLLLRRWLFEGGGEKSGEHMRGIAQVQH